MKKELKASRPAGTMIIEMAICQLPRERRQGCGEPEAPGQGARRRLGHGPPQLQLGAAWRSCCN